MLTICVHTSNYLCSQHLWTSKFKVCGTTGKRNYTRGKNLEINEFLKQYEKEEQKNKVNVGRSKLVFQPSTLSSYLLPPVKHIRSSSWITEDLLNKHHNLKFCFSWLWCLHLFHAVGWSVCFMCHCISFCCSFYSSNSVNGKHCYSI